MQVPPPRLRGSVQQVLRVARVDVRLGDPVVGVRSLLWLHSCLLLVLAGDAAGAEGPEDGGDDGDEGADPGGDEQVGTAAGVDVVDCLDALHQCVVDCGAERGGYEERAG
jgi:hypothetical protein